MWKKIRWPSVVEVHLSLIVFSEVDLLSSLFVAALESGRSVFFVYPLAAGRRKNSLVISS